jgi:hypothetical protein
MNRNEVEQENALEDARKLLGLETGDGSKELRKAYRMLARKYHPDKVRALTLRYDVPPNSYIRSSFNHCRTPLAEICLKPYRGLTKYCFQL